MRSVSGSINLSRQQPEVTQARGGRSLGPCFQCYEAIRKPLRRGPNGERLCNRCGLRFHRGRPPVQPLVDRRITGRSSGRRMTSDHGTGSELVSVPSITRPWEANPSLVEREATSFQVGGHTAVPGSTDLVSQSIPHCQEPMAGAVATNTLPNLVWTGVISAENNQFQNSLHSSIPDASACHSSHNLEAINVTTLPHRFGNLSLSTQFCPDSLPHHADFQGGYCNACPSNTWTNGSNTAATQNQDTSQGQHFSPSAMNSGFSFPNQVNQWETPHASHLTDMTPTFSPEPSTTSQVSPLIHGWEAGPDTHLVAPTSLSLSSFPSSNIMPNHMSDWASRNVDAGRQTEPVTPALTPSSSVTLSPTSDESRLRGFNEVFLCIKCLDLNARKHLDPTLEQILTEIGVKSCQDWLTTIIDDYVELRQQVSETPRHVHFIDAHKAYMTECLDILLDAFKEMNIDEPKHACSLDHECWSHAQPSFQRLREDAQDALQSIFMSLDDRDANPSPTREQLFFARRIGLAFSKIHVTFLVLGTDHNGEDLPNHATNAGLARIELELVNNTTTTRRWNNRPVEISESTAKILSNLS